MRILFYILIFITFFSCQIHRDNKNTNIDNSDVEIVYNYFIDYFISERAKMFLSKTDTDILKEILVTDLKNKDKALISHILLTKTFKPEEDVFSYSHVYDENDNIIDIIFELNGMKWHIINNQVVLVDSNLENLYMKWKERLIQD